MRSVQFVLVQSTVIESSSAHVLHAPPLPPKRPQRRCAQYLTCAETRSLLRDDQTSREHTRARTELGTTLRSLGHSTVSSSGASIGAWAIQDETPSETNCGNRGHR